MIRTCVHRCAEVDIFKTSSTSWKMHYQGTKGDQGDMVDIVDLVDLDDW